MHQHSIPLVAVQTMFSHRPEAARPVGVAPATSGGQVAQGHSRDDGALAALARAMATGLTPAIIHSGRTAAALLARGYPRHLIEIAIDEAERMALAGEVAHG